MGSAFILGTGDLDADGDIDLAAVDAASVTILQNEGGAFTPGFFFDFGEGAIVSNNQLPVGDLNGDGALDLAFTFLDGDAVRVMLSAP